jgi:hypothetical protein
MTLSSRGSKDLRAKLVIPNRAEGSVRNLLSSLSSPRPQVRSHRLTRTVVLSAPALNEEDGMKAPCAVNLHNAVTVSQQRLGRRVAQLSSARMNEVCAALRFSLGCDSN